MQHYFPYPIGQTNSSGSDCHHYNFGELQRARDMLIKEVDYGSLRWLTFKLHQFGSNNRAMVPNLWEGGDGLMAHICSPFPMPPCASNIQEELSGESCASSNIIMTSDNLLQQSCQSLTEMSTSRDLVDAHKDTETCSMEVKDKMLKDKKIDNVKNVNKTEIRFWIKMTKIYNRLHNACLSLTGAKKKLSDPILRRDGCRELRDLYRTAKILKTKLRKAGTVFTRCGYRNIFINLPHDAKCSFMCQHHLKGKLPTNFQCILSRCDKLLSRIKMCLHSQAEIIEPYKHILRFAIKDILSDESSLTNEPLLYPESSSRNEDSDCTDSPMEDSFTNFDTVAEVATVSSKMCSENENSSKDGKYFNIDNTKSFDVLADSTELDKTENTHPVGTSNEVKTDFLGVVGQLSEIDNIDKKLSHSIAEPLESSQENHFWCNLTKLRTEIWSVIKDVNIVGNMSSNPLKFKNSTMLSNYENLVRAYNRIHDLNSCLQKLKTEKEANGYAERQAFGRSSVVKHHKIRLKRNCSSIDVVEALMNKLKGLYTKVRHEKSSVLEKLGLVRHQKELSLIPSMVNTPLVHVCSHSETGLGVSTLCSAETSSE